MSTFMGNGPGKSGKVQREVLWKPLRVRTVIMVMLKLLGKKKSVFLVAVKVLPSEEGRDNAVRPVTDQASIAQRGGVRNVTALAG